MHPGGHHCQQTREEMGSKMGSVKNGVKSTVDPNSVDPCSKLIRVKSRLDPLRPAGVWGNHYGILQEDGSFKVKGTNKIGMDGEFSNTWNTFDKTQAEPVNSVDPKGRAAD